ncbi:MAG: twin-arginine translocase TatA/TatE family subunit [Rhodospirillaceae bacterium]|jgi:sec-independent protein translocase protein TatA|nr:twin-arginine translocase TatA/TatE family subunit [Rhodospirillaceae bacterium]MBT4220283.1 twin-arginine translocase TatA/TatE family subunit [Rhodospirillaceae bacterium]MBT5308027.1 twin-arginine translocase TatA/TatE family subunit [Rhodospirillaceae bacterium]MBT6407286.1 twin-arginine translocase TatA/TatE family subunit [Rhodospirillaceae bacterium]MBT7356252.1 twin-arginine translocase TatA/TatE family subunit [Rhodospirillaceae bacterium]
MGAFSIWHWLIVLAVVLVLFGGKGKISALMGDFGKGLKSFKKGMKDEEGGEGGEGGDGEEATKTLDSDKTETVDTAKQSDEAKNG